MNRTIVSWVRLHMGSTCAVILLFMISRGALLLVATEEFQHIPVHELWNSLWSGLPQDLSVAGYFSALLHLSTGAVMAFTAKIHPTKLFNVIWGSMAVCVACLYGIEASILPEWHMIPHIGALSRVSHPDEIVHVVTGQMIFRGMMVILITGLAAWGLYHLRIRYVRPGIHSPISRVSFLIIWIAVIPLIIIEIRGSVGRIPVSVGTPINSPYPQCNILATNTLWYLGNDLLHNLGNNDTVLLMDQRLADSMVHDWYTQGRIQDDLPKLSGLPNIVFIVLESWSAACIRSLHSEATWTSAFDHATTDGLLFTHMYSAGWTSDVGIPAIFSGIPGMVNVSFSESACPGGQSPSLFQSLSEIGYQSRFITGSDLAYANLRGYLRSAGVQVISERNDLDMLLSGPLGPHDGPLFDFAREELGKQSTPWITAIFTQSTHAPYYFPGMKENLLLSETDAYLATLQYADSCLGSFIGSLHDSPDWDHMLIVLVADHSHDTPWNDHLAGAERNRIPFLMTGGALPPAWRGQKIEKICSQTDIPASILAMLGQPYTQFPFSRNIFADQNPPVACYTYYKGVGLVSDSGAVAYDLNRRTILYADPMSSHLRWQQMMLAKAVLQSAMFRYRRNQGC